MKTKRLTLALLLLGNVVAVAFVVGQLNAPPAATELRWSESGRWIEVYHRGDLVAESQAADGVTFRELAWALALP